MDRSMAYSPKRSTASPASTRPMASEEVAAGDGALKTCSTRSDPPSWKSSTIEPSAWSAWARTPEGPTRWSKYGRFYPAAEGHVEGFRQGLDAALLAQRKQREHARLVREHEIGLIPLHERPDAVTPSATVWAVVGLGLSIVVLGIVSLIISLLPM